jgi:hypothetical protein
LPLDSLASYIYEDELREEKVRELLAAVGATPEEDEQRQRQRQRQRELAMEQQQPTTLARDGDGAGVPVPVPAPAPAGGRVSTQLKAKLAHLLD